MSIRKIRIEQSIQSEISQILLKELRDPRIGFCTITRVRVTEDYRYASVYVSFLGKEDAVSKGMEGIQAASKHIQALLAQRLNLKFTPYLRFIYDDSFEKGISLIEKINAVASADDDDEEEIAQDDTSSD